MPAGRIGDSERRDAILFRTHEWTAAICEHFQRLVREVPQADVCIVAYIAPHQKMPEKLDDMSFFIGRSEIETLPYPGKLRDFTPARPGGGNDLPVMWFYRNFPGYERYWVVEYDVYYSGNWGALVSALNRSRADLLATVVQDFKENPDWFWWPHFSPGTIKVPRGKLTKCFPPFCRLTNKALRVIDETYRQGVSGHYEVTWTTICRLHRLRIEDIGGRGRYTPWRRRGRYYTTSAMHWTLFPGTFVFRPSFLPKDVYHVGPNFGADLLWHPVKP